MSINKAAAFINKQHVINKQAPALIFLKPFSILYNEDKSKTKETSSKVLRCITWLCHPDEEENRRIGRGIARIREHYCREGNASRAAETFTAAVQSTGTTL